MEMALEEQKGNCQVTTSDGFIVMPDWDGEANPHVRCYTDRVSCPLGIDHDRGSSDVGC